MAHITKKGIVLRNPAEKAKRFASQLKSGKVVETGKKLSGVERAYRVGYLNARSDNAKAFKYNQRKNNNSYEDGFLDRALYKIYDVNRMKKDSDYRKGIIAAENYTKDISKLDMNKLSKKNKAIFRRHWLFSF